MPTPGGPPRNRMVVAVLSLAGFFVAFYMLAPHLGLSPPLKCGLSSCEVVQASPYAMVGPIPVAAFGTTGFAALFVLSLVGLSPARWESRSLGVLMFLGALGGVAYCGYLTYLEAMVIHAWCQWCITSAVLITLTFFATIPELKRLSG